MVALCSVFLWLSVLQWCSVLNKMAVILSRTIENPYYIAAIVLGFPLVQL